MKVKDLWELRVGDKLWHLEEIRNEESPVTTTFNYQIKACNVTYVSTKLPYRKIHVNLPGNSFIPVGDRQVDLSEIFLSKREAVAEAEHLRSEQIKILEKKVKEFASFYKKAIDSITIKVKK